MTEPRSMAGETPSPPQEQATRRPSLPCLLAQLDTPPEVAPAADDHCRRYGFFGRQRAFIEEELKVQFYFGGLIVLAAATRGGLRSWRPAHLATSG